MNKSLTDMQLETFTQDYRETRLKMFNASELRLNTRNGGRTIDSSWRVLYVNEV